MSKILGQLTKLKESEDKRLRNARAGLNLRRSDKEFQMDVARYEHGLEIIKQVMEIPGITGEQYIHVDVVAGEFIKHQLSRGIERSAIIRILNQMVDAAITREMPQ